MILNARHRKLRKFLVYLCLQSETLVGKNLVRREFADSRRFAESAESTGSTSSNQSTISWRREMWVAASAQLAVVQT